MQDTVIMQTLPIRTDCSSTSNSINRRKPAVEAQVGSPAQHWVDTLYPEMLRRSCLLDLPEILV